MRKCVTVLVMVLAAVGASGCGTVCNLCRGEPELYGGVKQDIALTTVPLFNVNNVVAAAVILGVCGADVCLSGVGDTVTIPIVLRRQAALDRPEPIFSQDGTLLSGSAPQYSAGATVRAVSILI
jgi:uncharacterized protein YceK